MALLTSLALLLSAVSGVYAFDPPSVEAPSDAVPEATYDAAGPGTVHDETGAPGQDLYIVLHQAPSLAQYRGEVAGLAATSPAETGARKLDTDSAASVAYLGYLATQHADLEVAIERTLGRAVEVVARYDAVLNGIAVRMNKTEALEVSSLAGVRKVSRNSSRELLTDNGPRWIGADEIWGEDPLAGVCSGSCGEGVVVGVIDTGINHDHPSFAEVGPIDGYVHSNPRATFLGLCDPITGLPFCNDKLIGYYDFTAEPGGPDDLNGHGSHTASTAAGNVVDVVLEAPTTTFTRRISGVAPHANIVAYKACGDEPSGVLGCFPTLVPLLAAINQATLDQVDVVNYSIGGGSGNPWVDDDAQAFFDAYTAGIFVAASAGNEGPGAGTHGSPADAPWVTAVGASTHDRKLSNGIVNMSGAGAPADIFGKSLTGPLSTARVVYAGDYAAESSDPGSAHLCGAGVGDPATGQGSGGNPWPAGTFNGEIVVCERGEYGRVAKGEYVKAAGAGGMVLANDVANGNSLIGDPHVLPAVHISYDDGEILKAWIAANGGKAHAGTGEIRGSDATENAADGDIMAGFSSRGPNPSVPGVIKPDVTAPGVDILAAFHTPLGTLPGGAPEFGIISGTSMSSPHTAGAGALVIGAQPDWNPDQVKSALMSTAFNAMPGTGAEVHDVLKEDGTTKADPFDMGGGRIDLRQAADAGLILEVGTAAYEAANPGLDGDPTTLNMASLGNAECEATCSWTRTVEATVASTWTASTTAPMGMTLSVSPTSFSLAAGETQEITVTANVAAVSPKNIWNFAEVRLAPSDSGVPGTHFPVAVFPKGPEIKPAVTLYLHGNLHDECDTAFTGEGRADLVNGCDPFMSTDPELDSAPAAKWGPLSTAANGTAPQNIYDPNWIWNLTEETTLQGPMVVEWWAGGPLSNAVFADDFDIKLFADGVLVVNQRVAHNITQPNVPEFLSSTIQVPAVTATTSYVVQIDPVYVDSQQGSFIYYDSSQACPGASGLCNSRIGMPVITGDQPPVAIDDSAFVISGGTVDIDVLANDYDPEGGPLVVEVVSAPANGTADVTFGKTIEYSHDGSATTSDSFVYRITDNQGLSAEAVVTITISTQCFEPGGDYSEDFNSGPGGWTVDTAVLAAPSQTWQLMLDPVAGSDGWFTDALASDGLSDTTKDVRLVSPTQLVSADTHLTFSHRYDTEPGFDGGVLEVRVDGGPWQDVLAAGGVFVAGGYDAALSSGGFVLGGRQAWTGASPDYPLMTDVDVDLGALVGQPIEIRYRFGQDQLQGWPGGWWIDDVGFSNLNRYCSLPPVAEDDSANVAPGGSVEIDVKANDDDPDTAKPDLTVTIENDPGHGTAEVQANGNVLYTHNGDAAFTDSFQYRVTDPDGNFDVATVSIAIDHVNEAPVANDDLGAVTRGGSTTVDVKANDSDPDHANSELIVSIEVEPAHGTVGVTPDGKVTYTHSGNNATADEFQYRITDPGGLYDIATVDMTIEADPNACRNELCANGEKPDELTLTYTGGGCADSANSQGGKSSCVGSDADGDVFVKATNKENAADGGAKVFYAGSLFEGETFTLLAANAGEKDFGSKVFVHIYAADGVTLLQTVEIHTSCSAPLVEGEQFGALKLGDADVDPEAPICTSGEGRVHGSGAWERGSGEKYDRIDFSFDAKHHTKGTLKGKLKVHDKGANLRIEAKTITSLSTGTGLDCDGVILDGVSSFAFTAEGTIEVDGVETAATFSACGVDNGKNNEAPFDFFSVSCLTDCTYSTRDRTPDSFIDKGNIHLHDAIVDPT